MKSFRINKYNKKLNMLSLLKENFKNKGLKKVLNCLQK